MVPSSTRRHATQGSVPDGRAGAVWTHSFGKPISGFCASPTPWTQNLHPRPHHKIFCVHFYSPMPWKIWFQNFSLHRHPSPITKILFTDALHPSPKFFSSPTPFPHTLHQSPEWSSSPTPELFFLRIGSFTHTLDLFQPRQTSPTP